MALKVIDVDSIDVKLSAKEKDESIKDFLHEIGILRNLSNSRAKNVNLMYEAFEMHSQLWIVTEYCPGGSLHTLVSYPYCAW